MPSMPPNHVMTGHVKDSRGVRRIGAKTKPSRITQTPAGPLRRASAVSQEPGGIEQALAQPDLGEEILAPPDTPEQRLQAIAGYRITRRQNGCCHRGRLPGTPLRGYPFGGMIIHRLGGYRADR